MSSDLAIQVKDVTKRYLMYAKPDDRLKQMIYPKVSRLVGLKPKNYYTDFAAVSGIDLDVYRGETVGIVGRNGSGKSTLLQMICGTLHATSGDITVKGRIAALLELGSGFNPDFSGEENVFLNAAILGLTRSETESRFDSIAKFADIGEFMKHPVKTYSSGMYVRLAFAVAINVDPDILVVDEALSVGDEAFQRKCFARIEQIRESGGTILFVSHGAQTIVQLCDRAILLDSGEKLLDGDPKTVVSKYQRLVNADEERYRQLRAEIVEAGIDAPAEAAPLPADPIPIEDTALEAASSSSLDPLDPSLVAHPKEIEATNQAVISDVRLEAECGTAINLVDIGQRVTLRYRVTFNEAVDSTYASMAIRTVSGLKLFGASTRLAMSDFANTASEAESWDICFSFDCPLTPGVYFFTVAIGKALGNGFEHYHRLQDALAFRVKFQPDLVATGYIDAGIVPVVSVVERAAA